MGQTNKGIQLEISEEQLQKSFQSHLDKLLEAGTYANPVKKVLDSLLGYSGTMEGVIGGKIKLFLEEQLDTPEFQSKLGESIANEMARRAVDALDKSKQR